MKRTEQTGRFRRKTCDERSRGFPRGKRGTVDALRYDDIITRPKYVDADYSSGIRGEVILFHAYFQ